jgi:hypothetical protein
VPHFCFPFIDTSLQCVQLGVALTPGTSKDPSDIVERMQAITGPWPNFVHEIQSQVLRDDGFGNSSFDWGRARGRDLHGLASIVYLIEQLSAHRVPPTAQTMERWLIRTTQAFPVYGIVRQIPQRRVTTYGAF